MQGRAVMSLNQNYSSTLRYLRSREINVSRIPLNSRNECDLSYDASFLLAIGFSSVSIRIANSFYEGTSESFGP